MLEPESEGRKSLEGATLTADIRFRHERRAGRQKLISDLVVWRYWTVEVVMARKAGE
jgi:hypothetical protein